MFTEGVVALTLHIDWLYCLVSRKFAALSQFITLERFWLVWDADFYWKVAIYMYIPTMEKRDERENF